MGNRPVGRNRGFIRTSEREKLGQLDVKVRMHSSNMAQKKKIDGGALSVKVDGTAISSGKAVLKGGEGWVEGD